MKQPLILDYRFWDRRQFLFLCTHHCRFYFYRRRRHRCEQHWRFAEFTGDRHLIRNNTNKRRRRTTYRCRNSHYWGCLDEYDGRKNHYRAHECCRTSQWHACRKFHGGHPLSE